MRLEELCLGGFRSSDQVRLPTSDHSSPRALNHLGSDWRYLPGRVSIQRPGIEIEIEIEIDRYADIALTSLTLDTYLRR